MIWKGCPFRFLAGRKWDLDWTTHLHGNAEHQGRENEHHHTTGHQVHDPLAHSRCHLGINSRLISIRTAP